MSDPALIDLVRKALTLGLSNCVDWANQRVKTRIREDMSIFGLTPDQIRELLIQHAATGGTIEERAETREPWKRNRDFWYFAILPVAEFPHGLFVELELIDTDPHVPMVAIVNAHRQLR